MDKVLEFGRKAMLYVRVLSGYEEHRIRSYRLHFQKRLQQGGVMGHSHDQGTNLEGVPRPPYSRRRMAWQCQGALGQSIFIEDVLEIRALCALAYPLRGAYGDALLVHVVTSRDNMWIHDRWSCQKQAHGVDVVMGSTYFVESWNLDAEEKKAALKRIPEQIILSEVRCMVKEMQALNSKLEETEAAIDEYFKPIDKEAEIIMKMQLEGEEKSMREMMKVMQTQALLEKAEADRIANVKNVEEINQHVKEETSSSTTPVEVR
ncbi:hypothetical protein TEA_015086 [Camellia sinensis var. sinensis]|uniref:Uncharacterized protein n=1 Tax=Camellia sinensis var. sinensis TaxID=542762 RepID=A0A4S4DEE6_CAMSN|nr:hypothetical protein TEA_015086 [Camellia sinensis var. sinensis]